MAEYPSPYVVHVEFNYTWQAVIYKWVVSWSLNAKVVSIDKKENK